jgi:hypothetical protein
LRLRQASSRCWPLPPTSTSCSRGNSRNTGRSLSTPPRALQIHVIANRSILHAAQRSSTQPRSAARPQYPLPMLQTQPPSRMSFPAGARPATVSDRAKPPPPASRRCVWLLRRKQVTLLLRRKRVHPPHRVHPCRRHKKWHRDWRRAQGTALHTSSSRRCAVLVGMPLRQVNPTRSAHDRAFSKGPPANPHPSLSPAQRSDRHWDCVIRPEPVVPGHTHG